MMTLVWIACGCFAVSACLFGWMIYKHNVGCWGMSDEEATYVLAAI